MHHKTDASSSPLPRLSSRLLYPFWLVSIVLVAIGELLPASSPAIRALGRLPVGLKVLHFSAYTWLAFLALIAIHRRLIGVPAALAMALLGVALEFAQRLVPGRRFEIRDMFINALGCFAGIAIGFIFATRRKPARIAATFDP